MSTPLDRRAHRFVSGALLALSLSVLLRPMAFAAEPPPSPEAHGQAQRHLAAGQKLLGRGQFEAALERLRASYAAEPSGAALIGMAEAERHLDRPAEAYRDYERALSGPPADLLPGDREAAQRALAELVSVTGTVKAVPSEPGAACAVDGRSLAADEIGRPLHLAPGRHVLEASKPGFETLTFPVWVTAGKTLDTTLTLKRAGGAAAVVPAPAPPKPAPLSPPPPPAALVAPVAPPAAPAPPPPPAPAAPPPPSIAPPAAPPAPIAPPPPSAPPAPVAPPAVPPAAVAPPAAPPAPVPAPSPTPAPVPSPAEVPPASLTPAPATPPAPPPDLTPLPSASQPPLPPPFEPTPTSPQPPTSNAEGARLGLLIGVLTFPRPIEGEVVLKLGRSLALGLKGGYLPELEAPGGIAKLDLKAIEGTLRWFPGQGVFFLGAGLGYQNLLASLSEPAGYGELTISADMSGFFVSPHLGVLWISQSGFALSFSLGLQIPIPRDPVVSATYNGQPVPSQPTSTVPQSVIDQANSDESTVRSLARFIVKYPFPNIDLLRIGYFF